MRDERCDQIRTTTMSQTRRSRPEPPSGTVTFLFTDVEGSTKLWEDHPAEMRVALARHEALMRQAIFATNGYVFKTMGDAFCAAFVTASEAVAAALKAQQDFASEPWPKEAMIKVRMALHSGSAQCRDEDYFGPPVNRVARLLSTAHGGQTILSNVTHDLCQDSLPEGSSLKPLGEHRLKDLGRPESVFQLCHSNLTAEYAPLRSLDNPELKHNLPRQVTSFVGREKELSEVVGRLGMTRLLTLTGAGGTGKTRLALQVAADALDVLGDGVWLVELAALSDPVLVPKTVADILGVKEQSGKPITQSMCDHLKAKNLLLVLDNCEHLLDACATLADAILRSCPQVITVSTSREPLGIAGETIYRVPSLSLPDLTKPQSPESLSQFESVRLFVDRAGQVHTGFEVTNQNAPALASLCHRLDGIPLAIELAAARVRSLSVEDINARLDQRFRLLIGGSKTSVPRQQTLRALIDWSYDLLNDAERSLLRRLSVFSGGWTLGSAEQVCSDELTDDWQMLDLQSSLCDKSLVAAEPSGSSVRYRLLETVRQYAKDRLLEAGDGAVWRDRHLAHYRALAEEAAPQLFGPDQRSWLDKLETEHDNIRAALGGNEQRNTMDSLRLAGSLWLFWSVRGHVTEGREWLSRFLATDSGGASVALGNALSAAGNLAGIQGSYEAAKTLHGESLKIRRELGDRVAISRSLGNLGTIAELSGDIHRAKTLQEESLTIARETGNQQSICHSLCNLGIVAERLGDRLAARTYHEEGLKIQRELGHHHGVALQLCNLGTVAERTGDYDAARTYHVEGLKMRHDLGNQLGVSDSLEGLAALFATMGAPIPASRLWGAAERLRDELGLSVPQNEFVKYEKRIAAARASAADGSAFDDAWKEGRAMTMDQAISLALEL